MAPHSSFCTLIQTKVFPALGGGIELPKTFNKTNDPSCSEWNVWHDIVIPPACFTLSCVRMDSRMLSGGQEDRDLTLSFHTRLRLLTPFLNTWRYCVFPVHCRSFQQYEKFIAAFRPRSNDPESYRESVRPVIWKKFLIVFLMSQSTISEGQRLFLFLFSILPACFDRVQKQVINKLNERKAI